ncbi:hypothetical protein CP02DC14_2110B, partial [Chlamydia psittaci 02DC14]
TRSCLFSN